MAGTTQPRTSQTIRADSLLLAVVLFALLSAFLFHPSYAQTPGASPQVSVAASPAASPSQLPASPSQLPASPSQLPASPSQLPASPSQQPASPSPVAAPSASSSPVAAVTRSPAVTPGVTPSASPQATATATFSASPSPSTGADVGRSSGGGDGLSDDAKIGLGVGLGVGIPAVLLALGLLGAAGGVALYRYLNSTTPAEPATKIVTAADVGSASSGTSTTGLTESALYRSRNASTLTNPAVGGDGATSTNPSADREQMQKSLSTASFSSVSSGSGLHRLHPNAADLFDDSSPV